MSFSGKIKEELARQWSDARHCQIAELAAIISMCGKVAIDSREKYSIKVRTENVSVARKYFTLLKKTFNIKTDISIRRNVRKCSASYSVIVKHHEDALRILQATKMIDDDYRKWWKFSRQILLVVRQTCCRRDIYQRSISGGGLHK